MEVDSISMGSGRLWFQQFTFFLTIMGFQIIVEPNYQRWCVQEYNNLEIYCFRLSFRVDKDGRKSIHNVSNQGKPYDLGFSDYWSIFGLGGR